MKKLLYVIVALAALLALAEVGLRVAGFKPYDAYVRQMQLLPKSPFVYDSITGYRMAEGTYTFIDEGSTFTATHNAAGCRVTSPADTAGPIDSLPSINIYGGPATYGYGLSDNETFPYIFQGMLSGYKVNNYAVIGFGVMGNYLQMVHSANAKPGDVFLLTYNVESNVRPSLHWKKAIHASVKAGILTNLHLAEVNNELKSDVREYKYEIWPLSNRLALVNTLEDLYNDRIDKKKGEEMAKRAFVAMSQWCKERGCTFILIGRRNNEQSLAMLDYCAKNGVKTVTIAKKNISLGIGNHGNLNKEEAADRDPRTSANKIFADELLSYLVSEKLIDTATAH